MPLISQLRNVDVRSCTYSFIVIQNSYQLSQFESLLIIKIDAMNPANNLLYLKLYVPVISQGKKS